MGSTREALRAGRVASDRRDNQQYNGCADERDRVGRPQSEQHVRDEAITDQRDGHADYNTNRDQCTRISRSTIQSILERPAPSAMRMPISFVRLVTT